MKKALLLLLVIAFACSRESHAPGPLTRRARKRPKRVEETTTVASTDVGATMPPYQATTLDGAPFDLAGERGKVVFLNLWATWCGPCRREIPELETMHAKYAARGFEVVGISLDESGADVVRPFVKEQEIKYPIVLDPANKAASLLQTTMLPTSIVIDRNGKIVWRHIGALIGPDATLGAAIEKALSK